MPIVASRTGSAGCCNLSAVARCNATVTRESLACFFGPVRSCQLFRDGIPTPKRRGKTCCSKIWYCNRHTGARLCSGGVCCCQSYVREESGPAYVLFLIGCMLRISFDTLFGDFGARGLGHLGCCHRTMYSSNSLHTRLQQLLLQHLCVPKAVLGGLLHILLHAERAYQRAHLRSYSC